jgi:hypothetical protein
MNTIIFETRRRAEELMKEALKIWRQSERDDLLEGIEDDPVFSILMSAMAYQAHDFDSKVEHFKDEVINDYRQSMQPMGMQRAIPATAVVETALLESTPQMTVDSSTIFTINDTEYSFIPLFTTQAINMKVHSVVRIDGRRWKVTFNSKQPVNDLSDFCFAVKCKDYYGLNITMKGQPVPLVKPWQYADLPFCKCFSVDSMLYNKQRTFNVSSWVFDLFARHDIRMYCIRRCSLQALAHSESDTFDLVFEFTGIDDNFVFDKSKLALNVTTLVNARIQTITLSTQSPIHRVGGGAFLHVIRPYDGQIYSNVQIDVRRVAADRFNRAGLLNALQNVINRYDTDYYAFSDVPQRDTDRLMMTLRELMHLLSESKRNEEESNAIGVYLSLRNKYTLQKEPISVSVSYLTTNGAQVNKELTDNSTFQTTVGIDNSATRLISAPMAGCDELTGDDKVESMTRYQITTQDRIVTQADIKAFCINELFTRYGIGSSMIRSFSIDTRQQTDKMRNGYDIVVDIMLENSVYVKRSFESQIPHAELLFNKMMAVRSANVYPIHVNIELEK